MKIRVSVLRIYFIRLLYITALFHGLFLQTGCSVTEIHHQIPPSPYAISGIKGLYLDNFRGTQSVLFSKILIHEISQLSSLKYFAFLPENEEKHVAVINAKVKSYKVNDLQKILQHTHISLLEKEVIKENHSGINVIGRAFEFVEKPLAVRSIERTLYLEIDFQITNSTGEKTLFSNLEKASLKQSYTGEENILLIPDKTDEMVHLAQLLIKKFLHRINPEKTEKIVVLEKGSEPIPWSIGLLDFGHPRIIRSNHFATGGRYDLALKGWNYVLFEPRTYPESETFEFTDNVYTRLKKAKLPSSTLSTLLEIHGKEFNIEEIDVVLMGLISNQDYNRYAQIIKSHSSRSQKNNRMNLAAAHYNIGSVYQLRNEMELAAYHFAQANAYNPDEKYALAWNDIQHILGNYNPFDALNERNVESAGKLPPPDGALLQPSNINNP
jgi:hypothetical protein